MAKGCNFSRTDPVIQYPDGKLITNYGTVHFKYVIQATTLQPNAAVMFLEVILKKNYKIQLHHPDERLCRPPLLLSSRFADKQGRYGQ